MSTVKKDNGSYANIIRTLRRCSGLTIQEMADRCGLSAIYLHELELKKKTNPTDQILKKIADGFGISLGTIRYFGEVEPEFDYQRFLIKSLEKLKEETVMCEKHEDVVLQGRTDYPDPSNGQYDDFLVSIRKTYDHYMADEKLSKAVFRTDAANLFDLFLDNIPDDAKQHYRCNACRHFVENYGGLVVVDPDTGKQYPIMWLLQDTPEYFRPAVEAIHKAVRSAHINDVFVSGFTTLGTSDTCGYYKHMYVKNKQVFDSQFSAVGDAIVEARTAHELLSRALSTFSEKTIATAIHMLTVGNFSTNSIDLHINTLKLFLVYKNMVDKHGVNKSNLLWYVSAIAPVGVYRIANSVLGTLMSDIADGLDSYMIEKRFNDKVDPRFYQRPVSAPTQGAIDEAEKKIAELGVAESLKRRYAKLEELDTIWMPTPDGEPVATEGVFGSVIPKMKNKDIGTTYTPSTRNAVSITWVKFRKEVLPTARNIWANAMSIRIGMGAMLTAVDYDAPPILRYDTPERRNRVSWYTYSEATPCQAWGIVPNRDIPVTAVALQPNMWGPHEDAYIGLGEGVFFIVKGARDTNPPKSLGLFPQILKGELYDVRKVIEAYSNLNAPEGAEEATACGVYITKNSPRTGVLFRVKSDYGEAYYNIDRWD